MELMQHQEDAEVSNVGFLGQYVPAVPPTMPAGDVLTRFETDAGLIAIPVVSKGIPLGIVSRRALIEQFAQPYKRELAARKPISVFMNSNALVVDGTTDIDYFSRIVIAQGVEYLYEGFIITEAGRYSAMGRGFDLMRAVTERKQAHLYRLAHFDALTGLPNRLLFRDRLQEAVVQAQRSNTMMAVLLLDLDRFKTINDTLGHVIGDALLKAASGRLSRCVRRGDTVARLGGDEFTLILQNVRHVEDVANIAQKILQVLSQPIEILGYEMFISASIGISIYPFDDDPGKLLENADAAMYRAKEQGRNSYQFYTLDITERSLDRLRLETSLRYALDRSELELHYQPQISLRAGAVLGVEALIRWRHPEWGMVQPQHFIPVAEETGMIEPIGQWVLKTACEQACMWRDAGLPIRISINVSPQQCRRGGFVSSVVRALAEAGLEPWFLALEITESVLMHDVDATIRNLGALAQMGVGIAVDDFGVGYSSLSYLKRFPIDALKMDRSFVCGLPDNDNDAAIARAIIALAHSLGLQVIAEGVENEDQLQFLRAHGCEQAQGYLWGKPLAVGQITQLLLEWRR